MLAENYVRYFIFIFLFNFQSKLKILGGSFFFLLHFTDKDVEVKIG